MKLFGKQIFVLVASAFAVTAVAADFDGSESLICSLGQVIECDAGSECRVVSHESVDAPDFVKLDFRRKKVVATTAGEDSEADDIDRVENVTNHLIAQGVQGTANGDTLGWSLSVNHVTGRMVLTGSGENAGFVVFGACSSL